MPQYNLASFYASTQLHFLFVEAQDGVAFCLCGHGKFVGETCPQCTQHLPIQFLTGSYVEYDIASANRKPGDNSWGDGVFLPEALGNDKSAEDIFEEVAGLSRCHVLRVFKEQKTHLEGDDLFEHIFDLQDEQSVLCMRREQHYATCHQCALLRKQQAQNRLHMKKAFATISHGALQEVLAQIEKKFELSYAAEINLGHPVTAPEEILSYTLMQVEQARFNRVTAKCYKELRDFADQLFCLDVIPANVTWRETPKR